MDHPDTYRNKQIVVLGLARSGRAVAELFHRVGAVVTVSDMKARHDCPEADDLEAMGITVICGHHPDDLIHPDVALLVKNPGIPYFTKPIEKALALGIEVVSEIEVAHHICKGKMIGITGSNGKTTTTTWIAQVMADAGLDPIIAGNIGRPLCEAALEAVNDQWLIVELSSFQLKGTRDFRAQIAVLLNISETHLDYHGSMDDYIASKRRLLLQQTDDDIAIVNWDDPVCREMTEGVSAKIIPFSTKQSLTHGVCIHDGWIIHSLADGQNKQYIMPINEIGIRGEFNLENALATTAVALELAIPADLIAAHLSNFKGVEHRLEFVKEWQGVSFYNNSKSTNTSSTIKALQAFAGQSIILIAGGMNRGSTYEELIPVLQQNVKGLITLGGTKGMLNEIGRLAGVPFVQSVEEQDDAEMAMNQAVALAYSIAEAGDLILLSPACASWDMFESYEVRGSMFKQAVHTLN